MLSGSWPRPDRPTAPPWPPWLRELSKGAPSAGRLTTSIAKIGAHHHRMALFADLDRDAFRLLALSEHDQHALGGGPSLQHHSPLHDRRNPSRHHRDGRPAATRPSRALWFRT